MFIFDNSFKSNFKRTEKFSLLPELILETRIDFHLLKSNNIKNW